MELNYHGKSIQSTVSTEVPAVEPTGMVHGRRVTFKQYQVAQRQQPVGELFYQGRRYTP